MVPQTVNPHHFISRAEQITAPVPMLLLQWGLLPKFKHWRLMQDSETGMVILFAMLDYQHIATHITTLFSDYYDPRLLDDLATELNVQVTSCSNDGLRYTFRDLPIFPKEMEEDHSSMHQRLDKFLKMTGAMDELNNAANQHLPDVLFMDEAEFNQQMAEYENDHNHREINRDQRCYY